MILTTSDIHSPKYLPLFLSSLNRLKDLDKVELVILAGDLVYRGRVESLKPVCEVLKRKLQGKRIVSVFGNEEYFEIEDELKATCDVIEWVDDDIVEAEVKGEKVVIIGSRGVLDEPTKWQRENIPNIRKIYDERLLKIQELLKKAKSLNRKTILVTHYTPTFKTLIGEPKSVWPQMGSKRLEQIILKYNPDIVIHGHAHNSKVLEVNIGGSKVYNLSLIHI